MPSWAEAEPTAYWDAADLYERANGRLFKRVEVALPTGAKQPPSSASWRSALPAI